MARARAERPRTEPAHGLLYAPGTLEPAAPAVAPDDLLAQVTRYLEFPLNPRQEEGFRGAFLSRVSLLWGPPGTGKTTVVAAVIMARLEEAWKRGVPAVIGV